MTIYLSHQTSLQYWRSDAITHSLERSVDVLGLEASCTGAQEVAAWRRRVPLELPPAVDVLTDARSSRRYSHGVVAHLWTGPVPYGSFYEHPALGDDAYLSGPEFSLLQMAPRLDLCELILAASDLCARYNKVDGSRPPALLSRANLLDYGVAATGAYALGKYVLASRHCFQNAWSHKETEASMALFLPRWLGGALGDIPGFAAVLNHRIAVPPELVGYAGRETLVVDMHAPQVSLAIEYNGEEWHRSVEAQEDDETKRVTLEHMGQEVRFLRYPTLADPERFELFAAEICLALKIPYRQRTADELLARDRLRSVLGLPY